MVRRIFSQILLGLLLLCLSHAQYQMCFPNSYYFPQNWPLHILKFSEKGTLKDIFDAGMRPCYLPNGKLYSQLSLKHVRVKIQQPDGTLLPEFAVDYADIAPLPSGIYTLNLTGHAITLEQARSEILLWSPFIEGKLIAELDRFLANVRAKFSSFDDVDFSPAPNEFKIGWKGNHKERYTLWLQKAFSEEVPLRMRLLISWSGARTPLERRTFYDGQIPSPEGYEPMQETKYHGPDDTSEMKYAKGISFVPGCGLGGVPNDVIELDDDGSITPKPMIQLALPHEAPATKKTWIFTEKASHFRLWLLGIFVLLSAISGWMWKRFFKKSP